MKTNRQDGNRNRAPRSQSAPLPDSENGAERLPALRDLEKELNPRQLEAVLHESGPLLIFAGAGSGKTRVLIYRLAHLICDLKQEPSSILAVTFTNKAAKEMKERVHQLIGDEARGLWIGTFHAICARLLRSEISRLGYSSNFVVFDDGDQQATMRDVLRTMNLDQETYPPRMMLGVISRAKEALIDEEDYARTAYTPSDKTNARVYKAYQQQLRSNNALDFDDLITLTVKLFTEHEEVRARYQERFHHVMVDEFQDVNLAQYRLIRLLTGKHRNIVCVGDDDQSIYGWRGADVGIILRFEDDFPDATIVKLEQNYRSTSAILDCANLVVRNNGSRRDKALWTENPAGSPIRLYIAESDREEARLVASRILTEVGGGRRRWGDFGILYRTNSQSRVFEETFRAHQIPYRMVGGQRFYERKEIKDLVSYLRVIYNPEDSLSTRRAVATPSRAIGPVTLEKITSFAEANGLTLSAAMYREDEIPDLNSRARNGARTFGRCIHEMRRLQDALPVGDLVERLLETSGYMEDLRAQKDPEKDERIQNVHEFLNSARQFEQQSDDRSLRAFLETLALASDLDTYEEGEKAVTMMTLHSAKGLEFPAVFLVGLEEGLFPHQRVTNSQDALEEERRLCYVGITRAREELVVSRAESRMVMGMMNRTRPSRFLQEMRESLAPQRPTTRPRSMASEDDDDALWSPAPRAPIGGLFPSGTERMRRSEIERGLGARPASQPAGAPSGTAARSGTAAPAGQRPAASQGAQPAYAIGDRVRHGHFGVGVVVQVDGETVRVAFEGQGIKKLQLGIVPLEKIQRK
jgi:DNA helicase II / ATP-dependent DNA helicase PcrA